MAVKKPTFQELATDDSAHQVRGFGSTLVIPSDNVLRARGGHYRIYSDLLRDDQVASTLQQRRLALTQAEWRVDAAGKSRQDKALADFIREQLEGLRWDDHTAKMHYATFYGYAVGECMWAREGNRVVLDDIKVRRRERFGFDQSRQLYLVDNFAKPRRMPERKFWTVATGADNDDDHYGLGLAHALYWLVYFKRHDFQFWLSAVEKFGSPTATAKVPMGQFSDDEARQRVHDALDAIHTDSSVVLPDNAEIELLEAFRSGASNQGELLRVLDAAIAKVVLSQTMTTDNGSSRAQAEVHQDVKDEVVKADADLLHEAFINGPVRWLRDWNFPNAALPRVYRDLEPEEDLNQRAERDKKIHGLGYKPTEDYIRETYGEGWVARESQTMRRPSGPGAPVEDEDSPAFAEPEELASQRNGHRSDTQAVVAAARAFAHQYPGTVGERVQQVLEYAEQTEDWDAVRAHLADMLIEDPPEEAVERTRRGGVVGRLMGALRQQRN